MKTPKNLGLPVVIELAGHPVSIVPKKLTGAYGECDEVKREISIDLEAHTRDGVDPMSTLFHELLHMAFGLAGLDNILDKSYDGLEECIVKCLENSVFPVLHKLVK